LGGKTMRALLLSGGLDSAALAWWKRPDVAVTVDYGQRAAEGEIAAARGLTSELGIGLETMTVDLCSLGAGRLSGQDSAPQGITDEWWPYRNQLLVTLASMRLITKGLSEIMLGAVSTDIYADTKAPFIRALDRVLTVQEGAVRLVAPARSMSTLTLLKTAHFPPELLGLTFSCDVNPYACGRCRSCEKHAEVIEEYLRHIGRRGKGTPEPSSASAFNPRS
jgi:7-cyano-7-deazaguanine synthase